MNTIIKLTVAAIGLPWVAVTAINSPSQPDPVRAETWKPAQPVAQKRTVSPWLHDVSVSPLDDSKTVSVWRLSEQPTQGGYRREHLTLLVACKKAKLTVAIRFGGEFPRQSAGHLARLSYRVDTLAPEERSFVVSDNYEWLVTQSGDFGSTKDTAMPFIADLLSGSTVFVRTASISGNYVDGRFTLTGLKEEIKPVLEACRPKNAIAKKRK